MTRFTSPFTPFATLVANPRIALAGFLLAAMLPFAASAQDWDDNNDYSYESSDYDSSDRGRWGVNLGLGLTASPTNFLVDIAIPYLAGGGMSIGPRVQVGLSEKRNYVAPTLAFEYSHDLSKQVGGSLGKIRPLVHAGIGFAWLEEDNRIGDDTDTGFLVDVGLGAEYPLSDTFSLASVIDFNILPKKTLGEHLVFSWQIVQLRARF